jgi:hypothetical protein
MRSDVADGGAERGRCVAVVMILSVYGLGSASGTGRVPATCGMVPFDDTNGIGALA